MLSITDVIPVMPKWAARGLVVAHKALHRPSTSRKRDVTWEPNPGEASNAPPLANNVIYRDYAADPSDVFSDVARTVARLGHKIYANDPVAGRLAFLTWPTLKSYRGQDMTATVTRYGDRTRLEFKRRKRSNIQVTEWGEDEKRARQVLLAMDPTKPVLAQNLENPRRKYYNLLAWLAWLLTLGAIFGLQVLMD